MERVREVYSASSVDRPGDKKFLSTDSLLYHSLKAFRGQ
jgi:hypothetical protein